MKIETSPKIWIVSAGYGFKVTPGIEQSGESADERWYKAEQTSHDHEEHHLRREIRTWLDDHMHGRWKVADQGSGPEGTWLRPIYFRRRADAVMFKMQWQNETSLRDWGEKPTMTSGNQTNQSNYGAGSKTFFV